MLLGGIYGAIMQKRDSFCIIRIRKEYYMRIGTGYDVHKLTEGRKLILGGVEIEHTLGLLGHSDADVLLHEIGRAHV